MIRRILTAAILIPIVLASVFFFPMPVFLVLLDVFLFFGLKEFSRLAAAASSRLYPSSFLLCLLAPWIVSYQPSGVGFFALASILLTFLWVLFKARTIQETFASAAANLFALCYLAVPFSLIATFHPASFQSGSDPERPLELVFILLIVWLSDSAALFVGRAMGRHRITPAMSPNKTLEGYLAALLVPTGLALALGHYLLRESSNVYLAVMGAGIAGAGTLGDLFESVLKRGAGIKDTSALIPGHGGILDRMDSLLFAVPAYHLMRTLLESIILR